MIVFIDQAQYSHCKLIHCLLANLDITCENVQSNIQRQQRIEQLKKKEMMSSGWLDGGKTKNNHKKNVICCWDTTMAKERFLTQFSLLSCVCAFKRMILSCVCMCIYSCKYIFKEVTNELYYVMEMLQENFTIH